MKIRLEIIDDHGSTTEIEINGIPTSESILKLVNRLMNVYNTNPGVTSLQPDTTQTAQTIQTQPGPRTQSKEKYNQPQKNEKHNTTETRLFNIAKEEYSRLKNESLTIKERLELFLNYEYENQWFTSIEVKNDYDRVYGDIHISTVSTYLSRLYREGKLERLGNRNQRKYRILEEIEPDNYSLYPVSIPHTAL